MLPGGSFSQIRREREEVVEQLLEKTPDLRPRNASKNNAFVMKKYYKLLLVAVTLLSLLCFIFYKSQYDKLYNVLQVLEFYETKETPSPQPSSSSSKQTGCPVGWEDFNRRNSDPLPGWKSLNPDVWIFSAHCAETHCPMATALALAREDALKPGDIRCKLWHAQSANGVEGIFAFQRINNNNASKSNSSANIFGYVLSCENKYSSIIPHGISFHASNASLFLNIGGSDEEVPPSTSISLCIAPQASFRSDSSYLMLENVLWHSLFGVNNFYLYDGGSTKKFLSLLGELGLRSTVTLLPWSLSAEAAVEPEELESLLQLDCHLRSSKKFLTFALLGLQQILVPKSAKTLVEEFESLIPRDSKRLRIPLLRFCAEFPEEHEDVVVTALGVTMYYSPLSSSISLVHGGYGPHLRNVSSDADVPKEISKNVLSVNDYSPCNNLNIDLTNPDTVKDSSLPNKFKADFIKKYKHVFPHKDL